MGNRRVIRLVTATLAATSAVIYVLIGVDAVTVIEDQAETSAAPLFVAAALFGVLAVLLVITSARSVLIGGAVLQVAVLLGYVAIAVERTPAYEAWGIGQKVLQAVILVALVELIRRPHPDGGRG
ncbi:MAG: hypothetical protein EA389_13095 [Ilumatobacter sp.]|nr:MAG: hypothetical protein EA389_13095 [Ilumatobacter sp.]